MPMSSNSRLSRAYKNAKTVPFDDDSKFILFSDCHRGDNSFADDFANNRNIYYHALKHYYLEGFQYWRVIKKFFLLTGIKPIGGIIPFGVVGDSWLGYFGNLCRSGALPILPAQLGTIPNYGK